MKLTRRLQRKPQQVCHDIRDFISVPGFASATRVLALAHSTVLLYSDARDLSH